MDVNKTEGQFIYLDFILFFLFKRCIKQDMQHKSRINHPL